VGIVVVPSSSQCRLRTRSYAFRSTPRDNRAPAADGGSASTRCHALTANPFRFVARVVARLRDIDLARTASSLSFTTLLAIVPLVTVAFAFVARFPIFEDWLKALEQFLLRHLLPFSAAAEIRAHIVGFADQAAQLTGISIVAIALSAALAVATVEREINAIWGIRRGRSFPRRVLVYAVGLTAGPVLLGASISVTTWLVVHSLAVVPIRKTVGEEIAAALPFLFSTAGLTLLYKAVPARHVAFAPAFAAGLLAAGAFEGAKHAFGWYLRSISTYQVVYGALAALPIFLLWIYLCWIIILAGAAVSATIAEPGGRRARRAAALR
jgi:membrane protein